MFDLEKEIDRWREQLKSHPNFSAEQVEELEAHVRDAFSAEWKEGRDAQTIFNQVISNLGQAQELSVEFGKVPLDVKVDRIVIRVFLALGLFALLAVLIAGVRQMLVKDWEPLLTIHVSALAIGWTLALIAGMLADYFLLRWRFGGGLGPRLPSPSTKTFSQVDLTPKFDQAELGGKSEHVQCGNPVTALSIQ